MYINSKYCSYSNLMRIIADTIIAGKLGKIEYCEIKKVSATILTYEGLKLRQNACYSS